MSKRSRHRLTVYLTLYGAVLAITWFLLHEDMAQFWTVLRGAAGFLLDRWGQEKEDEQA